VAEIARGEQSLLTSKWGPLPVWLWGGIGLLLAWLFAKWRDSKTPKKDDSADTADLGDESESEKVAPQFIIENNMPAGVGAPTTPAAPVPPPSTTPVVTPPSKGPNPPVTLPGKLPGKPPSKKKTPLQYKVKHGDTLSSIAKRYHTTWQALWKYNTTAGNRPASTIATLKKRGPNLLYANETVLIPQ
jgi:LysM repeat protein